MTASGPWLTEASATRDVEPVAPNRLAAGERINNSHRHVRPLDSSLTTMGPSASPPATTPSVRRSPPTWRLLACGLGGAHRIALDYAQSQVTDVIAGPDLAETDDIRRDRSLAEHDDFAARHLSPQHVRTAADVAEWSTQWQARSCRRVRSHLCPPTGCSPVSESLIGILRQCPTRTTTAPPQRGRSSSAAGVSSKPCSAA